MHCCGVFIAEIDRYQWHICSLATRNVGKVTALLLSEYLLSSIIPLPCSFQKLYPTLNPRHRNILTSMSIKVFYTTLRKHFEEMFEPIRRYE
jgi:hypothetical protein